MYYGTIATIIFALSAAVYALELRQEWTWMCKQNGLQVLEAIDDWENATDLLREWRKARPLLFVSESPYAQGLILNILQHYERMCGLSPYMSKDEAYIARMHRLLTEKPPPHNSPNALPNGGVFSF